VSLWGGGGGGGLRCGAVSLSVKPEGQFDPEGLLIDQATLAWRGPAVSTVEPANIFITFPKNPGNHSTVRKEEEGGWVGLG